MPSTLGLNLLLSWLASQSFTPPLRTIRAASTLPPQAYPSLSVLAGESRFTDGGTQVEHDFTLRVECTAGQAGAAQAQAQELARQLRAALHRSHHLGGAVAGLATRGIVYSTSPASAGETVTAQAELRLTLLSAE